MQHAMHVSEEGSRSVRAMFICTRLKEEEKKMERRSTHWPLQ